MKETLRVAINAQLMPDGASGGIATVLRALASVASLDDGGAEEYVFVGPHEDHEWLRPMLPPGQRIVRGPAPASFIEWKTDRLESFKRALGPLRPAARNVKRFLSSAPAPVTAAVTAATATGGGDELSSSGNFTPRATRNFYESLNCDVVHFPFQKFEPCALPAVYNPHDLQHLHHPEFFTPEEIARRERLYPAACHAAHTVVVASQFVKRDVIERYRVEPGKVQVIPWAPPPLPPAAARAGAGVDEFAALKRKYELTEHPFALYPAMTWEHKNHLRLIEALARLRDDGDYSNSSSNSSSGDNDARELRLVCTGYKTDFWPRVERRVSELGLEARVKFLGLVAREELSALYRAAQFVFIPTLFEAASAPVFEAWQHGAPVACSSVTSLPEQAAGGAALLFDPRSVEEIARALSRMATDENLRDDLRRRGARRLEDFSLERTAKAYRAVYRRAAGRALGEEDRDLLSWDWARDSRGEVGARRG